MVREEMGGGDVETDYDLICCDGERSKGDFVLTRYDREMPVLWLGAFGGRLLPPQLMSLTSDTIILTQGYTDNVLPDVHSKIQERLQRGNPECSLCKLLRVTSHLMTTVILTFPFRQDYGDATCMYLTMIRLRMRSLF